MAALQLLICKGVAVVVDLRAR
uniref:Uncharacterized protein n=1 Tax=Arundo donax TaxID=35708 RepID=A0A0A9FI21_ARUDO